MPTSIARLRLEYVNYSCAFININDLNKSSFVGNVFSAELLFLIKGKATIAEIDIETR